MTDRKFLTREQLIAQLEWSHSEEFCTMFLGFLDAQIPELRTVESQRLLDSWEEFKRTMRGK